MKARKSFLISAICLFLGFMATISLAQPAPNNLAVEELGAGAKLVVTSVSGPTKAVHNQSIPVTYTVENQGTVASASYKVELYLSTDRTIKYSQDRLLDKVTVSKPLEPGEIRKATTKVRVPMYGLSGRCHFGVVVSGGNSRPSEKPVKLARYSLTDDNNTVTDHQTGRIWQRTSDGQSRNWADAIDYCQDLVLGGKSDWRLPGIDELETIVDYYRAGPAIDPVFGIWDFPYWSSTTNANDSDQAWDLWTPNGDIGLSVKDVQYYVRCVREP